MIPGSLAVMGFGAASVPAWVTLIQEAEAAAAAIGASLWYVPPDSYAPWAVNGPFVNSDQTGGNPVLGSGSIGWLKDRISGRHAIQTVAASKPTLVAAPSVDAAAAGFGAISLLSDYLSTPLVLPDSTAYTSIASRSGSSSLGAIYSQRSSIAGGPIIGQFDYSANKLRSVDRSDTNVINIYSSFTMVTNTFYTVAVRRSAARTVTEHYVEGALHTAFGYSNLSNTTTDVASIGCSLANNTAAEFFNGTICGVCVAPADASNTHMHAIGRLLAYIAGTTYLA